MIIINARFLSQPITGVQRYAIELCLELKKNSNDFIFVAPKNIIHDEIAKNLDVLIVGNLSGHLWEQIELARFVAKRKAVLVNLCNTAPIFYQKK